MAEEPDEVTLDPGQSALTIAPTARSSPATADEIRSQIEETRAEMSDTIDGIQERLSPGRLMTHAIETVREATVGRVKNLTQRASSKAGDLARQSSDRCAGVVHKLKNNPVPVAVASVAATWLLVRALKRPRTEADRPAKQGAEGHTRRGGTNAIAVTVRNNARFLLGAGAGVACWRIWKSQNPVARFSAAKQTDANPGEAIQPPLQSIGSQPLERRG